jgi:ubiquinone/menaquinone biosynthesis C-methylase UbiE
VVSNYAFHHLDDPGKEIALAEARRVLEPGGRLIICDMMFALSFEPRDRRLITQKLRLLARRGPAGVLRIARNAGRVLTRRWEQPAPAATWERMLSDRGFNDVSIELLENEAGIAAARRPASGRALARV